MAKLTLNNIGSRYGSIDALNDNSDLIEAAFENTLSRDGTGPNNMESDLDMDSNDIINVGDLSVGSLRIGGQPVSPGDINYTGMVKETIVATAGQTVFNLTSVSYAPLTNNLSVYVDGVYQNPSRYTETSSTRVTFSTGLHVGAVVDFAVLSLNELGGTTDACNITYTPAGSGAVATTVCAKLKETVSVTDFGAVGDGVADDRPAIVLALATGKPLYFPQPAAYYNMGSNLTITSPFQAGLYRVFGGAGQITFAADTVTDVYPEWWATNTTPGTTDMAAAIQSAVNAAPFQTPVCFVDDVYRLNASIDLPTGANIQGRGNRSRFDFDNVDGLKATTGFLRIENIAITLLVPYSITPNSLSGIYLDGALDPYHYGTIINNVNVDGFSWGVYANRIYDSDINRLETKNTFEAIRFNGQSIGNFIRNCILKGADTLDTKGIYLNNIEEACMMQNNVIFAVDYGVYSIATSNCQLTNCTIDTFNQVGVALLADGNDGSYNWRVLNNIIGTKSATANAGILVVGSNTSGQDDGSVFIGNYIRAYNGGVIGNGIDTHLSGTGTFGTDIIMGNIVTGCTSRDIWGNANCIVTANTALDDIPSAIVSGGLIANNLGNVAYQRAVNFATVGKIKITYDENVPTTGTWNRGDICYRENPSAGNVPGWVCVSSGTPGTWKAMAALAA